MLLRPKKACRVPPTETERVRRIFDKQAPKYDRSMSRFERVFFSGNREWVCVREIDLRVGDAEALDFPDESFDTVVCTYGLCTIPDDDAAVREAKRVLRPAGRILLAEHVRSPNPVVRTIQRAIDPLAHRFGGDHLLREPLDHLAEAGFEVAEVKRSKAGFVELVSARKPA